MVMVAIVGRNVSQRKGSPNLCAPAEKAEAALSESLARIAEQDLTIARLRDALERLAHIYESEHDPEVTAQPGWLRAALQRKSGEWGMLCQREEREAGRAYPRTCPTCKLGPCQKFGVKPLQTLADAQAEIARLKTEIERLGRDLNRAKYGEPDFSWSIHNAAMVELRDRAEKAEAALSESQAREAMAFEVAARTVQSDSGSDEEADYKAYMAHEIRQNTPADAQAALDARINAAKEEGYLIAMAEAKKLGAYIVAPDHCPAILAKIKKAE